MNKEPQLQRLRALKDYVAAKQLLHLCNTALATAKPIQQVDAWDIGRLIFQRFRPLMILGRYRASDELSGRGCRRQIAGAGSW